MTLEGAAQSDCYLWKQVVKSPGGFYGIVAIELAGSANCLARGKSHGAGNHSWNEKISKAYREDIGTL
jgi:hypothetical protein